MELKVVSDVQGGSSTLERAIKLPERPTDLGYAVLTLCVPAEVKHYLKRNKPRFPLGVLKKYAWVEIQLQWAVSSGLIFDLSTKKIQSSDPVEVNLPPPNTRINAKRNFTFYVDDDLKSQIKILAKQSGGLAFHNGITMETYIKLVLMDAVLKRPIFQRFVTPLQSDGGSYFSLSEEIALPKALSRNMTLKGINKEFVGELKQLATKSNLTLEEYISAVLITACRLNNRII